MSAEIAVFLMIIAGVVSSLQGLTLLKTRAQPLFGALNHASSLLVFMCILLAFITLVLLRVDSDFSVQNVVEHSNYALPLLFKIAGTWGNHEGSMLLWALVTSGFAAMLATGKHRHTPLAATAIACQGIITCGVVWFIVFTSNPFVRIFPPEPDGAMLNPLLQDFALAIHPPLLYLGYVGFSMVYSLAVAGLLTKKIDENWAAMVHPWIMFAWSSLTVGIALGSWWAYRELGWGGYWFWDPVENASLLPWLAGTALLHANIILKKRRIMASWVVLLAISTFALSLIGTFLVRSGVITSVHSFASDPTRGLYILAYIALTIGVALWLYARHTPEKVAADARLQPSSREGMIVINNLFILTACATVLLGTLYPLLAQWLQNRSLTVGAPYFNQMVLPMLAIPLFFAGLVPFMPWKKAAFLASITRAWPAFSAAACVGILIFAMVDTHTTTAALGLALASFLLVASSHWLLKGHYKTPSQWPVFLGHSGAALLIIGVTGTGLWAQTLERPIQAGERVGIAGYVLQYNKETTSKNDNFSADIAHIQVRKNQEIITTLFPEFRSYSMRNTTTSEAAIYSTPAYDLYAVIGEKNAESGERALRVYFKPTISFLWLGAAFITLGGLLAAWLARRVVHA